MVFPRALASASTRSWADVGMDTARHREPCPLEPPASLVNVWSQDGLAHLRVAEVDQAAEGDEGKEDRLFQTHTVASPSALLKDAALSDLRPRTDRSPVEEERAPAVTALELHAGPYHAIDRRQRGLMPEDDT